MSFDWGLLLSIKTHFIYVRKINQTSGVMIIATKDVRTNPHFSRFLYFSPIVLKCTPISYTINKRLRQTEIVVERISKITTFDVGARNCFENVMDNINFDA